MVGEPQTNNAQRDWLVGLHPVGRLGTVEEATQSVIALLENPFITESILNVDGGWTAQWLSQRKSPQARYEFANRQLV